MFLTRKLGKILRGNASPFQLVAACTLGGLLGFAPGFLQAPALLLLLLATLLFLEANLGLALLTAIVAKLASFVLAPVSFQVGVFLLEGPTAPIADVLVDQPVLAWAGFEYYAVSGGLLIGLVLGLLLGLGVARALTAFRRRMAAAEKDPGRLSKLTSSKPLRFLGWLLLGKSGKGTWEERLQVRSRNPVRVWGAVLLAVLALGVTFGGDALAAPFVRTGLESGLARANGATAEVREVELGLAEGRAAVVGLALADPADLDRDLFRADRLEFDVDQADVLRRRFHVAKLVVSEAVSGAPRETPGELVGAPPTEPEAPAEPEDGEWTLEDVLRDVELWRARLAQAREWLEKLSGGPTEEAPPAEPGEERESWRERVEREARERGWYRVAAEHLVDEAPTLRVSELTLEGLALRALPGMLLDVRGTDLSSHPRLVDAPPVLEVASRDGTLAFSVDLSPVSRGGGEGRIAFRWDGLSVDAVMAELSLGGAAPLRGGTVDLALDGAWSGGAIGVVDLPLSATFRNTVLHIEGIDPTPLDELALPIGLSGPIDAPRVSFDADTFTDALAAAGKEQLANELEARAGEALGDALEDVELPEGVGEDVEQKAGGILGGILGGKQDG